MHLADYGFRPGKSQPGCGIEQVMPGLARRDQAQRRDAKLIVPGGIIPAFRRNEPERQVAEIALPVRQAI